MQAEGYAVVVNGEIDVATVSPHARGAKVNWLYTVAHITVMNTHGDFMIERMWQMHHGEAQCLPVTIMVRG